MKIIPEYTFQTAPVPKLIVIPAQKANDAMLEWIRTSTKSTDVTMSVCTGAYVLARTGLLSGKSATTFHRAYEDFAVEFPDIHLKREPDSWKMAIWRPRRTYFWHRSCFRTVERYSAAM